MIINLQFIHVVHKWYDFNKIGLQGERNKFSDFSAGFGEGEGYDLNANKIIKLY